MSEIIVKFPTPQKVTGLNADRIGELWEEEFDKAEELGVKPTIGNCITLLCKGIVREMLGDEVFNINLEDIDDEAELDAVMNQAFGTIKASVEKIGIQPLTKD